MVSSTFANASLAGALSGLNNNNNNPYNIANFPAYLASTSGSFGSSGGSPFNFHEWGLGGADKGWNPNATSNEDLTSNINALYRAVSGTNADPVGLEHWLQDAAVRAGDYSGLANTLAFNNNPDNIYYENGQFKTDEARNVINTLYNEQLGRNALFGSGSDRDADYWVNQLKAGKSMADIIRGLSGSSEFLNQQKIAEHFGFGDTSRDQWGTSTIDLYDDATGISTPTSMADIIDKYVLPSGLTTEGFAALGLTPTANNWATDLSDHQRLGAINRGINALGGNLSSDPNTLFVNDDSAYGDNVLSTHQSTDDSLTDYYSILDDVYSSEGGTNSYTLDNVDITNAINITDIIDSIDNPTEDATTLVGGNGTDTITGSGGTDTITGSGGTDTITGSGGTDTLVDGEDTVTGGGGTGVSSDDMESYFDERMKELFSNNWTPYGYGWGGSNTDGVAINRSNASRMGGPYAGNRSSFGRSGYRLATTPKGSNSL